MRFNYKRKTYPAVKIGDVFYVRNKKFLKSFLKSECYKKNKKLKEENKKLIKENEFLRETLEQVTMKKCDLEKQLKHKNQLWKSAFKAYKKLKKKVVSTLFPVEYIDFIDHACSELLGEGDRVAYTFVMPWYKVKDYLDKKYKRDEELEELEEDEEL